VPPRPACQPAQPPDTVAMTHRLAPSGSPIHPAWRRPCPTVGGRCRPPTTELGPPLLPSPSSAWRTPRCPPPSPFTTMPHPLSLSPSSGLKGVGRYPVPLFTPFPSRPTSSTATPSFPASQARVTGLGHRTPDTAPPRRIWSHHCRHLGFTVSSTSPGFSAQFFLRASPPLCVPVLQVPPSPSIDHRSSSLTLERYCLAPTLPPLCRAAASMSPTSPLHAQRLPLSAPVLHARRLPFGLSAIVCCRPRGRRGCRLGPD
jgi:hypothetical protein